MRQKLCHRKTMPLNHDLPYVTMPYKHFECGMFVSVNHKLGFHFEEKVCLFCYVCILFYYKKRCYLLNAHDVHNVFFVVKEFIKDRFSHPHERLVISIFQQCD